MNNRREMTMKKLKELLRIFGVFFKIGAFTFGGGYAMIPLVKDLVLSYLILSKYPEAPNPIP